MRRPVGKHLTHEEHAEVRRRLAAGEVPTKIAEAMGCSRKAVWNIRKMMLAASAVIPDAPNSTRKAAEASPADPVEVARLKSHLAILKGENKELLDRARRAEDLRAGLFGLTEAPPEPVAFRTPEGGNPSAETIVLFLSDLHWGERVTIEEMDGLNSYNLDIARARLGRYFQTVADLATKHWTGPPPARLILILGGDLISGEIHAELAKTNQAKALPAVKDCASHLAEGVALLRRRLSCPIDILSLAGNHGRSTLKPEAKEAAETSYDTLVSDFLEMMLRKRKDVSFYVPASIDALFPVYGWRMLATHGDRIGSRGGQGFVGPAATAARGLKRIVADYSARGILLDLILIGHFHTAMQLEEGFVNGSLVGPSEYSRDGRFRPAPAQQLWLTIHPRRRVTTTRWINVGVPSEGAIYAPPAPDREMRPRWRVPAVSVPAE